MSKWNPTNPQTIPIEEGALRLPSIGGESSSLYSNVLQGKPIHGLIASSTKGAIEINAITHSGTMQSEGVLITIDEEAIPDITAQTFKVLILLLSELTAQLPHGNAVTAEAIQKGRTVRKSLADYMSDCKIRNTKEARAQLNEAVKVLYYLSLEWDEESYERPEGKSRAVKTTKHHRMRITDHTITQEEGNPVKRGVLEFRFSYDMAEYLSNAYIMPWPRVLLAINTRYHPYSLQLGWKLCFLHNVNFGKGDRANITTVKTLLSSAKGIPRYSDLAHVGKIYDRIIRPFDRDLDELVRVGVLSAYWYFDADGNRISSLASLNYTEFSRLYVHYELKDYPDQTPRLEAKRKRIKAAISRRKSAAKKKAGKNGDGAQ